MRTERPWLAWGVASDEREKQTVSDVGEAPHLDGAVGQSEVDPTRSFDNDLKLFTAYRDYVKHQYEITNHRTMWFATIQACLFAAFAFTAQQKLGATLRTDLHWRHDKFVGNINALMFILCIIGIVISAIVYMLINSARLPIEQLANKWDTIINLPKNSDKSEIEEFLMRPGNLYPLLVGGHSKVAAHWGRLLTLAFPLSVMVAWTVIALVVVLEPTTVAHFYPPWHWFWLAVTLLPSIIFALVAYVWNGSQPKLGPS